MLANFFNKICPPNIPNINPEIQNWGGYSFAGSIYSNTIPMISGAILLITLFAAIRYAK